MSQESNCTSFLQTCTDKIAALSCFSPNPPQQQQPAEEPQSHRPSSAEADEAIDTDQVNHAIQTYLRGATSSSTSPNRTSRGDAVLSLHDRGVTVVGWNDSLEQRSVIRVSPQSGHPLSDSPTAKEVSGLQQSADRIWLFGQFVEEEDEDLPGLVPFLSPPKILRNHFLVEQYEEILFTGEDDDSSPPRRLDLHTFVLNNTDSADSRKEFSYLHDVLEGVVAMHDHGWAHLDLSLENVVLSDDQAYIIDFESVLPFTTKENAYLGRKKLRVPVKAPCVPPEHFAARGCDYVSLPSYDVWGFGVMFFTVLFREHFIATREIVHPEIGVRRVPDPKQVEYFMAKGFRRFTRKYHPEKYMLLFHPELVDSNGREKINCHTASYLALCGDLLSTIFRRPCKIPASAANTPRSHCIDCDRVRSDSSEPIYFCDCKRATAQEVYDHPFWETHHIRPPSS